MSVAVRPFVWVVLALTSWFLSGEALAEGCYAQSYGRGAMRLVPSVAPRTITVLVDQTVGYDEELARHVWSRVVPLAVPGNRITVATFSYYSRYTRPEIQGEIYFEPSLPAKQQSTLGRQDVGLLKSCLLRERLSGLLSVKQLISTAIAKSRPSLGHSDIMSSLAQFGKYLESTHSPKRTLLIVSDMMENSSTMSFYGQSKRRLLSTQEELKIARRQQVIAQLKGVDVYIIGLGLPPADASYAPQSVDFINRLSAFWRAYFTEAGASRVTFGVPMLLVDLAS